MSYYHHNPASPAQMKTSLRRLHVKLETSVGHLQDSVEALARGEAINLRVRLASTANTIDRLRKEIDGLQRALDGRVSFKTERQQVEREFERAMQLDAYRERYAR